MWDSAISTRFPHFSMSAIQQLCGFAAALERLLSARDAVALDEMWEELNLGQGGWEALALARRANTEALEPALAKVDRRLLAVLERCRAFLDPHIVTFRVPELERWQHAAAAALVGARWSRTPRPRLAVAISRFSRSPSATRKRPGRCLRNTCRRPGPIMRSSRPPSKPRATIPATLRT